MESIHYESCSGPMILAACQDVSVNGIYQEANLAPALVVGGTTAIPDKGATSRCFNVSINKHWFAQVADEERQASIATIGDAAADTFTLNTTSSMWPDGYPVYTTNAAVTLAAITNNTVYWLTNVSFNRFQLCTDNTFSTLVDVTNSVTNTIQWRIKQSSLPESAVVVVRSCTGLSMDTAPTPRQSPPAGQITLHRLLVVPQANVNFRSANIRIGKSGYP